MSWPGIGRLIMADHYNISRFLPVFFSLTAFCLGTLVLFTEDIFTKVGRGSFAISPASIIRDPVHDTANISITPSITTSPPNFYIREKVTKRLRQWQIIQIYKRNIEPEDFNYEVNKTLLLRQNKTELMPAQKTCAVVGNSGILNDSKCGRAIDSHDYIYRMNLAPFGQKYAEDVGNKANITTLNFYQLRTMAKCARKKFSKLSSACKKMLKNLKLYNHSVIWYPKGGSRKGNMNDLSRGMKDQFRFDAGWAYSPVSLFGAIPRIWKYRVPSTGLLILSAASLFCERITMYGFYPFYTDSRNRTLMYHYYDSDPMNYTTNAHKMPAEFKLYLQLQEQGAVKIQQEECH